MQFVENLKIKLFSTKVGSDEFGNQYFQNKKGERFVVYKGIAEPSKIPMDWHIWIHYSTDSIPTKSDKFSWQKIHLPNLTGTKNAYFPDNSKIKTKKYQSWQPKI